MKHSTDEAPLKQAIFFAVTSCNDESIFGNPNENWLHVMDTVPFCGIFQTRW